MLRRFYKLSRILNIKYQPNYVAFSSVPSQRERLARLEIDKFDNPFLDAESGKIHTGQNLQTEPWPRRKLKELFLLILKELEKVPPEANYRKLTEELVRWRLKVVEEHEDVDTIERVIGWGQVEELIKAATNELKLIEIFLQEKPWEAKEIEEDEIQFLQSDLANKPFGEFVSNLYEKPPKQG